MSTIPFDILYEDNHLLVVNKPAGLPTMGVAEDVPSLLTEAKKYLKHKFDQPGDVYLGIVSRLDAPVSGVISLARTSKAAARLTEQFRSGTVEKKYWTLVEGRLQSPAGSLRDFVRKDKRHRRMHVTGEQTLGAQEARLTYRTLQPRGKNSLLEVQLETGRKHQIRLQFGTRGHPILGDRKYGATVVFPHGIALHARSLTLEHPVRREPLSLVAPLPPAWGQMGVGEGSLGETPQ